MSSSPIMLNKNKKKEEDVPQSASSLESEKLGLEIAALRSVIAPVTERFCSVETKVKQLLSRIHGFQGLAAKKAGVELRSILQSFSTSPEKNSNDEQDDTNNNNNPYHNDLKGAELSMAARVSIGIYGPKRSGKSSLLNSILGYPNLVPEKTKVPLSVVPTKHDAKPCLRMTDGRAIAADEEGVKEKLNERNRIFENYDDGDDDDSDDVDDDNHHLHGETKMQDSALRVEQFLSGSLRRKNNKNNADEGVLSSEATRIQQQRELREKQKLIESRLHINLEEYFTFDKNNTHTSPASKRKAALRGAGGSSGIGGNPSTKPTDYANLPEHLHPLTGETIPWTIIDHPPCDRATKVRFSSAAINSISPVEYSDDIIFYVIDARIFGTPEEVHVFDNLLFLHPEEKAQLEQASSFNATSSNKKKGENDAEGDGRRHHHRTTTKNNKRKKSASSSVNPFVSSPATRKRLLTSTFFFLSHIDAFPDSEIVLSRGGKLDMASAQIYDEQWSATHGQQKVPHCRSAEFALRRFSMLAEFVFGMQLPASHILAVSNTGIAHSKIVLQRTNINCVVDEDEDAAKLGRFLEEEAYLVAQQQGMVGGITSHKERMMKQQQQQQQKSATTSTTMDDNTTTTLSNSSAATLTSYTEHRSHADMKLLDDQEYLVRCMYQFSEWFLGPKFMLRADLLSYPELRRITCNFARYRSALTSGARTLDALMTVLLNNMSHHFFLSVANTASEITDSLEAARLLGDKTVASELRNARESEIVLTEELDWIRSQIDLIQTEARSIPERAAKQLQTRLTNFRDSWLEELADIFLRRPLEWFKSRQIATVRDIQAALNRYDEFSENFSAHHRYLHQLMTQQQQQQQLYYQNQHQQFPPSTAAISSNTSISRQSGVSNSLSLAQQQQQQRGRRVSLQLSSQQDDLMSDNNYNNFYNNYNNTSAPLSASSQQYHQHEIGQGPSSFIRHNLHQLFQAAIKSRAERFDEINTCIAHHLRDELFEFVRKLERASTQEQSEMLRKFAKFCRVPVANAKSRFFSGTAAAAEYHKASKKKNNSSRKSSKNIWKTSSSSIHNSKRKNSSNRHHNHRRSHSPDDDIRYVADSSDDEDVDDDNFQTDNETARWLYDDAFGPDVDGCEVVKEDTRLLNNFCREIVEPVTAAQAELILLEEEEEDFKNEQENRDLHQKRLLLESDKASTSSAGGDDTTTMISSSTVAVGSAKTALQHLRQAKAESTLRKREQVQELAKIQDNYDKTGSYSKPITTTTSMHQTTDLVVSSMRIRHRFMIDAWRLACMSLKVEQVAHFDLEPFISRLASFTAAAVGSMAEFSETLSLGIEEHAAIVQELEMDQEALESLKGTLPRVHRAIAVDSSNRYTSDCSAPHFDPRVLHLQKMLGMV